MWKLFLTPKDLVNNLSSFLSVHGKKKTARRSVYLKFWHVFKPAYDLDLVQIAPLKIKNSPFTLKTHQMFSIHTTPEEFENATTTGHFRFVPFFISAPKRNAGVFKILRSVWRVFSKSFGRLQFDHKFRGEFPEISMGKWYSLFPVWKTLIVCLEFFSVFKVQITNIKANRILISRHSDFS